MTPSARAPAASVAAALRRSSSACAAIVVTRNRDVPSGTVGGRIACANTPLAQCRLA